MAEREAIQAGQPLLNTVHRGSDAVELRAAAGYERARARWLWHASWMASQLWNDLDDRRVRRVQDTWLHATVDSLGFLVPAGPSAANHDPLVATLSKRDCREMLHEAARNADDPIRDAVGLTTSTDELTAWWAAHSGARYLAGQPSTVEAMAASLRLQDEAEAPFPPDLPSASACVELVRLAATLDGVAD